MLLKIRNVLCQWWRAESFSINFLTFLLPHFSLVIPFYYKNNISCEISFSILTHIICLNGSVSWKGKKTISVFGKTIPQHNVFIICLKNNPYFLMCQINTLHTPKTRRRLRRRQHTINKYVMIPTVEENDWKPHDDRNKVFIQSQNKVMSSFNKISLFVQSRSPGAG